MAITIISLEELSLLIEQMSEENVAVSAMPDAAAVAVAAVAVALAAAVAVVAVVQSSQTGVGVTENMELLFNSGQGQRY